MSARRRESIDLQYEPLFTSAVLASHFNLQGAGFRQRDVRFVIELFSNWMEVSLGDPSFAIQNVQVARFLDRLVKEGTAKKVKGSRVPRYTLSRAGLVRLLSSLVNRPYFLPIEHFFFIFYFLRSYGRHLEELFAGNLAAYNPAFRAELKVLRNPALVVENQLRFLDRQIAKLEGRIEEAREAAKLGQEILAAGGDLDEVVREIQRRYPYELNARKPLPELMGEIPEGLRKFEMTEGLTYRAEQLWTPLKLLLSHYRKVVQSLA